MQPIFARLLSCMFTLLVMPAMAAAAAVEIERMTWIEVRDRVAAGSTTIIIPTGGTEQNGAHMILGKHNIIVAETARRIAAGLGNALVAPVLDYSPEGSTEPKTGHMAYAGTISVPDAVFSGILEAAANSFKAHGFKTIVLLGDSGPNQAPQRALAAKLSAAWKDSGVRVMNADTYYAANGAEAYLLGEGETAATIGLHAGIRDTSELMAIDASGVRLAGAKPDSDGASGDPRRATVERGQKLLALKVAAAVAEIRAAQTRPQ
jgi:creatinine amidohydrolase